MVTYTRPTPGALWQFTVFYVRGGVMAQREDRVRVERSGGATKQKLKRWQHRAGQYGRQEGVKALTRCPGGPWGRWDCAVAKMRCKMKVSLERGYPTVAGGRESRSGTRRWNPVAPLGGAPPAQSPHLRARCSPSRRGGRSPPGSPQARSSPLSC